MRLVLVLACACACACGSPAQAPPTDRSEFLKMVQVQERSITYLRGQSYRIVTQSGGGGQERGGESTLRFVFETVPGGRFRLDYEPQTGPWFLKSSDKEPRCFLELTDTYGFDGRTSWIWNHASMEEGKPETRLFPNSVQVQARRHSVLHDGAASAWCMTLPGFYGERSMSFAEGLEVAEAPFAIHWDESQQVLILSLASRDGAHVERWLLARRWSYCLERYQKSEKDSGKVIVDMHVLEAKKLHEAFWYPTRITDQRVTQGGVVQHGETNVTQIDVADPDPSEFEPRFPAGAHVTDSLTGESVALAPDDKTLTSDLGKQGQALRELVLYSPPASAFWIRGAIAAALVMVGSWMFFRRRRRSADRPRGRSRGAKQAIGLLLAVGLAAPVAAQGPWVMEGLPGARVDNCGVNVAAVVSSFFGREPSLEILARELGCSERRHEAVSLADMEVVCRGMGLETRTFQQASLRSAVESANACRGIAVIMVATDTPVAHYVAVAPSAQGLAIVNPGASVRSCEWSDAYTKRISERFTGLGVLVWSGTGLTSRDIVNGATWRLPLSELVSGGVPVRNPTTAIMRLESVRASCGCIAGTELEPKELSPGSTGELRVRIDASRLGPNSGHQQVVLVFRSGDHAATVTVDLAHAGTRKLESAKPGIAPALVPADSADSGTSAGFVDILVPAGGCVTEWRSGDGVAPQLQSVSPVAGGVVCRYSVRWSKASLLQAAVRDGIGGLTVVAARLAAAPLAGGHR